MAVDVCSEISSAAISPRISFSQDLNQAVADTVSPNQTRSDSSLLEESDSGFDFCIGNFFAQELSSADELFSNGRILPAPVRVNKNLRSINDLHQSANKPARTSSSEKKSLQEFLSAIDSDEKPQNQSKSFWKFQRSSSLNSEISRGRNLIRSLHFLSRSNSTGSAPNPKPQTVAKVIPNQKPNLQRQQSNPKAKNAKSSSSAYIYTYSSSQKPWTGKSLGSNGNGVRISPVLNLPPPYIVKVTVSLFGFGSIFCNGKIKKKKK